jgi:RNA polymerase sigma factor (sigma-70 family)
MYASSVEQRRSERVRALAEGLYRDHHRRLLHIATRNAANRDDAEEALQDAFAFFIDHFDPDSQAPPVAWLTLTLKRRCWAKRRREHLDRKVSRQSARADGQPDFPLDSLPSEATGSEEAFERAEWLADARSRLAPLKPTERRALVLIAAGYTYREVAQITGWSYTKINRVATEGRAALRQQAA